MWKKKTAFGLVFGILGAGSTFLLGDADIDQTKLDTVIALSKQNNALVLRNAVPASATCIENLFAGTVPQEISALIGELHGGNITFLADSGDDPSQEAIKAFAEETRRALVAKSDLLERAVESADERTQMRVGAVVRSYMEPDTVFHDCINQNTAKLVQASTSTAHTTEVAIEDVEAPTLAAAAKRSPLVIQGDLRGSY